MGINDESLQGLLDRTPDLVDYLRNDVRGPHFSRADVATRARFIPPAFTNWHDEQYASVETAGLLHQTHHMPELFVEGPGAFELLQSIAINSFSSFALDQAKQMVGATPEGHIIGDCIVYRHGEERFELVSGKPLLNWVEYQAVSGGYDVSVTRDEASNMNTTGRRTKYRFELVGPATGPILERVVEGGLPEVPFFRTATFRIGGHDVLALRHGMVGDVAFELSGPFAEEDEVRSILLEAGKDFGIMPVGTETYFTGQQGGWISYPLPGIFTEPALRGYREWLPATGWEARTEIGGSFVGKSIEDYYLTPFDAGYGHIIKFDHDFHGAEALKAIPDEAKKQKVTLEWDTEDVLRVQRSQFEPAPRYKSIDMPTVYYTWNQVDEVRNASDEPVGHSYKAAYLGPYGKVISMASLDPRLAPIGSEVTITWGEPTPTRKPQVERHVQTTIRARVVPAPYAQKSQRVTRNTAVV